MPKLYIGLDIGGTKCAAIIGGHDGNILHRIEFCSGSDVLPQQIVGQFYAAIDTLLGDYNNSEPPTAIGISCGGPLDSKRGIIQCPPNLPLWDEIPICALLTARYTCRAFLQNDANACAIAEWQFGAGRGTQNMVFLTFGTGLGAGIILQGKLYEGTNGMAGEVGHIRLAPNGPVGYGKHGSFEGFCSGGGIRQLGKAMLQEKRSTGQAVDFWDKSKDIDGITAKDICIAAEQGNADARTVVRRSAAFLGRGIAVLIDVLNPECIVIGSIFARAENLFRTEMEAYIAREALAQSAAVCRIVPAALGDAIGDMAALAIAISAEDNARQLSGTGFSKTDRL